MERRPMEIEDLARITFVSSPAASPDGREAAFVATRIDLEADRYVSRIWLLERDGSYAALTSGPSDALPEWSPDGRLLAFASRRTLRERERGGEVWIARRDGRGEPWMVAKLEGGVEGLRWSPDGKWLLLTSEVGEPDRDVKIARRVPYWFNGRGLVYNVCKHLFLLDPKSGETRQLTKGEREVVAACWSPDSRKVAFAAYSDFLRPYLRDVYVIDVESGEEEKITEESMYVVDVEWSPRGDVLATRGHRLERGFSTHNKVWLLGLDGELEPISGELDVSNSVNSDVRGPGKGRFLQWGRDGRVYFLATDGGTVHLYRASPDGDVELVVGGNCAVDEYSLGEGRIFYVKMTSTQLPELWVLEGGEERGATEFNGALLSQLSLAEPERFAFKASDGSAVEGWVLKPANFEEGKRYPAVVEIHGGPMTAYGEGFMHEFHVLSGAGFVVIYTNPRGSAGYTEEFKDIRYAYGERDYMDIMEAVDHVLEEYGFVDPEKMGVAGGSYGGFMTNWIVTHTDRFRAAVTQRSICNWLSFYGTTDIGIWFVRDQIGGDPWNDFERLWDKSPLKYVENVETPLLIIHSDEDYRCWLDQALQMFAALKALGREVELAVFPGENHDLSRRGKPRHRIERLKRILGWFERHLKEASGAGGRGEDSRGGALDR